jgi:class 3 adenylate cyclase
MLLEIKTDDDAETFGLLGSIYKSRGNFEMAEQFYSYAYTRHKNDYWTGINTATLALLQGKIELAKSIAQEVAAVCESLIANPAEEEKYYPLASLAEAQVILGRYEEARSNYARAATFATGRIADLASTRRQLRLLLDKLAIKDPAFNNFSIPNVAVFTGHMVDRPDTPYPRFPQEYIEAVSQAIRAVLKDCNVGLGYCSGAAGSDLLFAQAILDLGAELHIILPFEKKLFTKTSLEVPGRDWKQIFDEVLARATSVRVVNPTITDSTDTSYTFTNRVFTGLAQMRASTLSTQLISIAVWDGQEGFGVGGTADHLTYLRSLKGIKRVERIIPLDQITGITPVPRTRAVKPPSAIRPHLRSELRAILFAKIKNYERLRETDYIAYVSGFLEPIGDLIAVTPPLVKNKWGNEIFMVFNDVQEAGIFAIAMQKQVRTTDWIGKYHLLENLQLVVSLHFGPVLLDVDPIINQYTYTGPHVSYGSKIATISDEGQIFASEPFAALSVLSGVSEYYCEYLGRRLTKVEELDYPVYILKERGTS